MTTDDDIVRALNGESPRAQESENARLIEAMDGSPNTREQARGDMLVEALEGRSAGTPEGVAPQEWAAKGKADAAVKTLSETIMRANPSKGIYVAEAEARTFADEAYKIAAKTITSEADRQDKVARVTAFHANDIKGSVSGN